MNIIFDLDGTLTDSGPGIIRCAKETFAHYGLPIPDDAAMHTIVGPPLRSSFARFGMAPERIEESMLYYRKLYAEGGIFENIPYPGIEALLARLVADGHKCYVATSKPEHMAVRILEHFGLSRYFALICGALTDGVRDKKELVIEYLLAQIDAAPAVMVGDTVFDVEGANVHHIPTLAVTWGYGDAQQMQAAGAIALVDTMEALYTEISNL